VTCLREKEMGYGYLRRKYWIKDRKKSVSINNKQRMAIGLSWPSSESFSVQKNV